MAQRTANDYKEQDKTQATDHDSLIRLEGKVDQVLVDIKELKDGTSGKIGDLYVQISCLEERIKRIEDLRIKMNGIYATIAIAVTVFGIYIRGFIEDVINHLYRK